MTKFLKVTLIIFLSLAMLAATLFLTYLIITKDAKLDSNKLIRPNQSIIICDENGNEIVSASVSNKHKSVEIENLSDNTVNAFIASEDRTFYTHKGLNYKRMFKALYTNIVSRSFKEGASTISQQLIKNTHLSNDKTIKRKLNEIRLTKQLERAYSKDEILEMYLNTIYFGHNCYGLQSAAEFYFDKKAEELSLTESATLVGLLTSPNNYSPFKNPEKSLQKRNTVLKSMLECGFISQNEYENAVETPLNAVQTINGEKNSSYINAVFDELETLDINVYDLTEGCIIKTYLNPSLQGLIEEMNYDTDNAVIITSKQGGVNAFKSTIGDAKRQTGSTIKPVLVYAPAIEEKIVSPFTKILDEKVDFGGYSPENYDKKYHGYVTVADSLKYSYNIPAVKTLNSLTINTAEKYLTRMNITLEDDEKNLSLALGGMKYGLSLKEIADRYSVFQRGGTYAPSRFIQEIISRDGKTIYRAEEFKNPVFSAGTCSLMNEMLIATSKSGTAKSLANLKYDVATKTGTCGNADGNTDAYAISYTSEHCIGVWLGDKDNKRLKITGGGDCCDYVEDILNALYDENTPQKLDISSGTSTVKIDAEDYYNNNKIIIADDLSPKLNVLEVKVLSGNEPKEKSTKFSSPSIATPAISVQNGEVNIQLCQTKYYAYLIKRRFNGQNEVIFDGNWQETIKDTPSEGCYEYTVTPYYFDGQNKIYGKEISLPPVNVKKDNTSPQVKIPDIAKDDWYDL
ncbi:MAG: transglycosylase domain-containing protein [Clostridia bacterium]|nr:transglycosylase domain-containing protein [Clostridia bacterium]